MKGGQLACQTRHGCWFGFPTICVHHFGNAYIGNSWTELHSQPRSPGNLASGARFQEYGKMKRTINIMDRRHLTTVRRQCEPSLNCPHSGGSGSGNSMPDTETKRDI
ncbi:hypothetical protein AG1IA_09370 [Rhizoctonia solani AG-1 IA]|uniref:Uncharacterized protein n=1 Tax=Thanatephorus cucumeris (strain AG1-IA) TaxID=983506 RepID=L8WIN3_THACA|nr:hypothetical protein AG1IA_09370 [Rhizoctonia solani AG-1 IA]